MRASNARRLRGQRIIRDGDIFDEDIPARIRGHARSHPERVALSAEGVDIAWGELAASVERIADYLSAKYPGETMALLLPNSPAFVLFFLAGVRSEKNVQVLDPQWPTKTTSQVIDHLRPGCVISSTAGGYEPLLHVPDPHRHHRDVLRHLLGDADTPAKAPPANSAPTDLEKPFYTGFTSGSTGLPKGFARSQRSWLESFRCDAAEFSFSSEDVFVAAGNLVHSLFLYALMRGLHAGSRTVIFRRFRPDRTLDRIQETAATVVYAVPTQYDAMTAVAQSKGQRFDCIRLALSSGAKLSQGLKDRLRSVLPGAEIGEFYGTSELSYVTVARDGEAPPGSVGRPFRGVDIRIRDSAGDELPAGETGRVFVASPLRFIGYASPDDALPDRLGDAICLGDVGYLDPDGFLFLVGRSDRMIVSSGNNIHPEEVESVLAAHPMVVEAAVVGIGDHRRGQRIVAIIGRDPQAAVTRRDLIAWCRARLPIYKVPMDYVELTDWPLTVSDKIDFPRLHALLQAGGLRSLP